MKTKTKNELSDYAKWYRQLKGFDFISNLGRKMNRYELWHNGFKNHKKLINDQTPYMAVKRPEPIFEKI